MSMAILNKGQLKVFFIYNLRDQIDITYCMSLPYFKLDAAVNNTAAGPRKKVMKKGETVTSV